MGFIGIFCLVVSIFLVSAIIIYQIILLINIENHLDIIENKINNIEKEFYNDKIKYE